MKTRKRFYSGIRTNPTSFNILDFVKVPTFDTSQKRNALKVTGKTIDDDLIGLLKNRDRKLKYTPRDNFYGYINQLWIDNVNKNATKKKTFYTKQDDIRIMQEDTIYSLLKVLKMDPMQKRVYESFKHIDTQHIISHIDNLKTSLQQIFAKNDFYTFKQYINKKNEIIGYDRISYSKFEKKIISLLCNLKYVRY